MEQSKAIYLLRKLKKQLQIDGSEDVAVAVGMAADSLSARKSDADLRASLKSENIPIVGRNCDQLNGVAGALKSMAKK